MEMKFYREKDSGKVLALLKGLAGAGEWPLAEIKANTTDAAVEKHVPVALRDGNKISVAVGSVLHPMEEKHFIEWIAIETKLGFAFRELSPGAEPKAEFALLEGDELVRSYAYCNLHGLWADR